MIYSQAVAMAMDYEEEIAEDFHIEDEVNDIHVTLMMRWKDEDLSTLWSRSWTRSMSLHAWPRQGHHTG